jgi:hypothetical protein
MSEKINSPIASAVREVIEERKEERWFQMRCHNCGQEYPKNSVGPAICGSCGKPMEVHNSEAPEKERQPVRGADDVLVSLGDLSEAKIEDITTGKNYEAVALDYIATFNGAVTQGVNPLKALMAMCQACAIVMGQCIRAGLRLEIALGLISFIVKNARKASGEVRIITKS